MLGPLAEAGRIGGAEEATRVAADLSGYRAGLLASIAAACTASVTVTLPTPGGAS